MKSDEKGAERASDSSSLGERGETGSFEISDRIDPPRRRRLRGLLVDHALIAGGEFLRRIVGTWVRVRVDEERLPVDAKLVNTFRRADLDAWMLVYEHESFDELEPAGLIPTIEMGAVTFEQLDLQARVLRVARAFCENCREHGKPLRVKMMSPPRREFGFYHWIVEDDPELCEAERVWEEFGEALP